MSFNPSLAASADDEEKPTTGVLTRSGLKYIDFVSGSGTRPRWGDFVRIQYVAYTITPDGSALRKEHSTYSSNDAYLIHHGNGEMVLGLEEALHSMSVGGRRRVIVPPQLAYNDIDLGPVPPADWKRRRFARHLAEGDGTVVFDVEMLDVFKDPDDRGFYKDETPTDEELEQVAVKAREEYAEELKKLGMEAPDPNVPIAEYKLELPALENATFDPPRVE